MLILSVLTFFGLALIFLEIFLPGIILGIIGSLLLISALVFVFFKYSLYFALCYIIFLIIALIATIKFAFFGARKNRAIFQDESQEGYSASLYAKNLIGKIGIVESDLKPSGHIFVEGKGYFQALSKGEYIEKGEKVKVVAGEGAHLIVKKERVL